MWSYYGTKKKLAEHYPKPAYDQIIEPFCGAAQYSLFGQNWKKDVLLVDKYQVITSLWQYLINVSEKDILALPNMYPGDKIDNYTQLCDEEKWLIGFSINSGSAMPKKTVKKFNSWNNTKQYIASNLYKIRHWKVVNGTYDTIENRKATWYIDPPYQFGGEYYRHGNSGIDFPKLAEWCKERTGQVIVCENTKADWLPFTPLKNIKGNVKLNGQLHETVEAIWYKIDTDVNEGFFEF